MATFGYARVSSTDQNLDRQIEALTPYITDKRYLYCDKASGKDFDRRAWRALVGTETTLPALQSGDLVVVVSLDRIGRNYTEIQQEWKHITQTLGANIKVLDMPLLNTSADNNNLDRRFMADLVLQILSYVAERERINIKARQAQGIKIALEKGIHFGRVATQKPEGWDSVISKVKEGSMTATAAMTELNLKRTTFYKLLKQTPKE
ncbi:recombinase family protein [uncultured Fibrobacter sp.]|uniref:recombinase family protein n=1 Tax=uncultured Fibrobacter sp. TaxID=261512 RepID=UPI0025CFC1E4|nr:recombinase family protein [uncultured Fibrobacter sp.]MBR6833813.1 recombinase family protein [Fibrobacter sp.]MBR6854693.1 recombinase family protein [Fibrobacter sp.]